MTLRLPAASSRLAVRLRRFVRELRLSVRLTLALTGILLLAAAAQTLVYFQTRNETLREAQSLYTGLAKAIEIAATQVGAEGWKDERVLIDYRERLRAHGLRNIQVTEGGRPFPDPLPTVVPPTGGKKKPKTAPSLRDIVITGVVGEGAGNSVLQIPLVIDGRYLGWVRISYSLENITEQLADNFRRRLFALFGVFALGLAVILVLTRNATRPVEDLVDAATRVAEGRLDVAVPVDREDEIGRLVATFNRMVERLRERQELEARLSAAEKSAQIGHLASGLAHEIKNPLNALSLGLDVLRRRHRPPDAEAAKEYGGRIEALREEISRLATLINNFLTYGRPISLNRVPTDLASLLTTTLFDLSETADQAHVKVEASLAEGLPKANVDPSLVKSAIWNLVQNGVQAMERTGGTLRVSLSGSNGAGAGTQVVTVEDEGYGIPSPDLPRLFEPYFSSKEAGVGLGLAMVKRIVEEHGGSVFAENRAEVPSGARFRIVLPG